MYAEFAPNFEARLAEQQAFEDQMLATHDEYNWGYAFGSYSQDEIIYTDEPISSSITDLTGRTDYLGSYELFLKQMIPHFLELKAGKSPTILLDIGGGAGASWTRLALCFQEEVQQGNLAFVVSNLAFSPDDHLAKNGMTSVEYFLAESQKLVHYVKGRFSEIKDRAISLPNGQTIQLARNVDLVNERMAITAWSKVPEIDILIVPPLLSPYGIYLVNKLDIEAPQGLQRVEAKEKAERKAGLDIAHRLLQGKHNLKKVTKAESGVYEGVTLDYIIFKASQAPLIEVN